MSTPKYVEERSKLLLGSLPEGFLRVESPAEEIPPPLRGVAHQPQAANLHQNYTQPSTATQITLCIVQAQLSKNYSLTKMDPYVRVRIGHAVFETHSDSRAGKFPNWSKTITAYLPQGIKTVHIEVFDERTLTPDERIAYADYVLPEEAFQGKFIDTWVPLSGRQGEEKEGTINITVFMRTVPYWSSAIPTAAPLMMMPQPALGVMPYYIPGQTVTVGYPVGAQPMQNPNYPYPVMNQPTQPYRPTEDDVKQMQEMFPAFDQDVIKSVLENCHGNKDQATNSLLSMSDK